jgi:hypothetical protein
MSIGNTADDLSCLNGVNLPEMPVIFARHPMGDAPRQLARKTTTNAGATGNGKGRLGMGQLIKALALLVILAFVGLVAYAYIADLSPRQGEVTVPVTLDAP